MVSDKDNPISEVSNIDTSLTRWKEQIAESDLVEEKYQHIRVLLTASIIAVILIFSLVIYSTVKGNLKTELIAESAKNKSDIIVQAVMSQVANSAKILSPHYRDLAANELGTFAPLLTQQVMGEMDTLIDEIRDSLTKHLEDKVGVVLEQKENAMANAFPLLQNEGVKKHFREHFNLRMETELHNVAATTIEKFMDPLENTVGLIHKFPPVEVSENDRRQTEKRFLKLWLELAALHMDAPDDPSVAATVD